MRRWVSRVGSLAAVAATTAGAQGTPDSVLSSGAFITRLGVDTVAVERFTRTATRLEGELLRRTPSLVHSRYVLNLVDGKPVSLSVVDRAGDGSLLPNRSRFLRVAVSADSVFSELQLDTVVAQRRAGAGGVPWLLYSWAMTELGFATMRGAGADSGALTLAMTTEDGVRSVRGVATWLRGDTGYQWNLLGAGATIFSFDSRHRLTRVDATETTTRFVTERLDASPDVPALARGFAVAEAAGKRFGSLNTDRDTTRAAAGAAHIVVDYGRPRLRGRRVFVNGVLGDTIWRTGANAATQIETSAALVIGGTVVPAGKYTLWTLVARDNSSYTLIVNTQTGQWGVPQFNYRPARDLLRVRLNDRKLVEPVEQFTIVIEPSAGGGVLKLLWDTTELSVPFTVAPR